jgi:hypothetical protein
MSKQVQERYVHASKQDASEKASPKSWACTWRPARQASISQSIYTLCVWRIGTHARYMLLRITSTQQEKTQTVKRNLELKSINTKECSLPAKTRIRRCVSESQACTRTARSEYQSCRTKITNATEKDMRASFLPDEQEDVQDVLEGSGIKVSIWSKRMFTPSKKPSPKRVSLESKVCPPPCTRGLILAAVSSKHSS